MGEKNILSPFFSTAAVNCKVSETTPNKANIFHVLLICDSNT